MMSELEIGRLMNLRFTVLGLAILTVSQFSWSEIGHGIGLGIQHQTQKFELASDTLNLAVRSQKIQYQLTSGPWLFTLSASEGDTSQSQLNIPNQPRYQLQFEQNSQSIYLDYNFKQAWVSVGISQTNQEQFYQYNFSGTRAQNTSEIGYTSYYADLGYGWYFDDGQLLLTTGITQQSSNEEFEYLQSINNVGNSSNQGDVNQSGWLGNINLNYQHYFVLNESLHGLIGAGINHSRSLDGETHLSQTTRTRLASTQLLSSDEEFYIESDSRSTSLTLQTGLITDFGNLNLSADKLTSENWKDSVVELGLTLYF